MKKVIINKNLIGDEHLYKTYSKDYEGYWIICKYFTLKEEYCIIEDGIKIEEDFSDIKEPRGWELVLGYDFETHFKIIDGEKYVILKYENISYKIPLKFYKNIIKKTGCYPCPSPDADYLSAEPLFFVDYEGIFGWLEPCVFEVFADNDFSEVKFVI